jgi:hypothetical protein
VNGVPVADQGEDEQQKRDQQQAGGFRGINRVPLMLVAGVVLALRIDHNHIVRREGMVVANLLALLSHGRGGGLVLHYASLVTV